MTYPYLHQTLAAPGTYEFLNALDRTRVTASPEERLLKMMASNGVDHPPQIFRDLKAAGILQAFGLNIGLSSYGIRTLALLEALNGGDLQAAFRRLSRLDSTLHSYELVREGMTDSFLETIVRRPGFTRLYMCSPWINLSDRNQDLLLHAFHSAEVRGESPEIIVLTRPDTEANPLLESFLLQKLRASIFLNSNLHTKLYIREPSTRGGYAMAVVGSQNLTRSRYLELGIRINSDATLVYQLVGYFWDLCAESKEAGGPL